MINNEEKSVGVIFGTFAPAHSGHYQNIMKAKDENDVCIVIVSGRKGDRGDKVGLSLLKRFNYMEELFINDENIHVAHVNEDNIPLYPNGWDEWFIMIKETINKKIGFSSKEVWYVGEKEYKDELEMRFLDRNQKVALVDRTIIPISGTEIRNNPSKYWPYITKPFRRHFSTVGMK